ncbi:MAG: FAD-dependent oxidoreductase [Propionibacteriaceae bacterium]|nr:FAD-dependent oxidoreductase [Propionibacteriaceae bacterium]
MPGHIIVGAGLAGAKAAQSLRREGYTRPLTLLGAEAEAPYNRPPLSKEYLRGQAERGGIHVLPEQWYAKHDVSLRVSSRVEALDVDGHRVQLSTGEELGYEKLLIATGSRVRRLQVPGSDLDAVVYLSTIGDSDRLKRVLATAGRIIIIGAGWVGLEIASAARVKGIEVILVEAAALPLEKVLGSHVAQHFATLHVSHGVDLRCGVQPVAITGRDGRATGVDLSDGTHIDADAVIVGIGVTPRTELAEHAGLAVDNGILVDASMRTSHSDVFAAGDVANAWHPLLGRHVRVEHWTNAAWQPRVASQSMLGIAASYDKLPHFFSDQYDLSMEYTGHTGDGGHDSVVLRGAPDDHAWMAFWLRDNTVLAGMHVNDPRAVRDITTLVRSGQAIDPGLLADSTHPLRSLLRT